MSGECQKCGWTICCCEELAAQHARNVEHAARLREALIELQSASWSRSWKRVKAARAVVKDLLGYDIPGPLTAEIQKQAQVGGED